MTALYFPYSLRQESHLLNPTSRSNAAYSLPQHNSNLAPADVRRRRGKGWGRNTLVIGQDEKDELSSQINPLSQFYLNEKLSGEKRGDNLIPDFIVNKRDG
jgi:hypothetical protein